MQVRDVKRTVLAVATAAVMVMAPSVALAHAGPHDVTTDGPLHALTEPDHVAAGVGFLLLLVGALSAVSVYRHGRARIKARRAARES